MDLSKIFMSGNLVDLCIRVWSGVKQLTPEDLGLDKDSLGNTFVLGKKKLIPPEIIAEFDSLDRRARDLLIKFSFPFNFGNARFVPKKVMPDFVTKIQELITEHNELADDLVDNYDHYKIQMREEYVRAAHAAYHRYKVLNKASNLDKDEYIKNFLARVDSFYPSASEVRAKFSMDYTVYQVALPDVSQASYADVIEDANKLQLMRDAYEHSLQRKINSFVDGLVVSLREEAKEVLTNFISLVKNKKNLKPKSMDTITNMIEKFAKMDIVGDTQVVNMLLAFKERLIDGYTFRDLRDNEELRKNAISEMKMILEVITNKASIEALKKEYRAKVSM